MYPAGSTRRSSTTGSRTRTPRAHRPTPTAAGSARRRTSSVAGYVRAWLRRAREASFIRPTAPARATRCAWSWTNSCRYSTRRGRAGRWCACALRCSGRTRSSRRRASVPSVPRVRPTPKGACARSSRRATRRSSSWSPGPSRASRTRRYNDRHDASRPARIGDRRMPVRCGGGARAERLRPSVDAHRLRQHPYLQLAHFSEVLDFWFGAPQSRERGRPRREWFRKSDAFDDEVGRRFLPLWEEAARGGLGAWRGTPLASLALVVVLDQFPRNMFRGTARAFATDRLALAAAANAIDRGFERALSQPERTFVCLPFEHAEELAAQRRSLELFRALDPDNLEWAKRHHEIIERFGGFTHRNALP